RSYDPVRCRIGGPVVGGESAQRLQVQIRPGQQLCGLFGARVVGATQDLQEETQLTGGPVPAFDQPVTDPGQTPLRLRDTGESEQRGQGVVQFRGTAGDRAPQFVVGQERAVADKTFAPVQRPQRYRGTVRAHNLTPRRAHAVTGPATADAGGSL